MKWYCRFASHGARLFFFFFWIIIIPWDGLVNEVEADFVLALLPQNADYNTLDIC